MRWAWLVSDIIIFINVLISNLFLGIVRAIDSINDQIFMLIPSQLDDCLKKISVLGIGNIHIPSELFIKQPNCISAPYTMRSQ